MTIHSKFSVPVTIRVESETGKDSVVDKVELGTIPPNQSLERTITVRSNYRMWVIATWEVDGSQRRTPPFSAVVSETPADPSVSMVLQPMLPNATVGQWRNITWGSQSGPSVQE